MPPQGYRVIKGSVADKEVGGGNRRVCVNVDDDAMRKLKAKLALRRMTFSEWIRQQIAQEISRA